MPPFAQDDFQRLDNSQKLHIRKSFQRLEKVGGQAGQALHGQLAGYRKLEHRKLGLRVLFRETPKGIKVIEVVANWQT